MEKNNSIKPHAHRKEEAWLLEQIAECEGRIRKLARKRREIETRIKAKVGREVEQLYLSKGEKMSWNDVRKICKRYWPDVGKGAAKRERAGATGKEKAAGTAKEKTAADNSSTKNEAA